MLLRVELRRQFQATFLGLCCQVPSWCCTLPGRSILLGPQHCVASVCRGVVPFPSRRRQHVARHPAGQAEGSLQPDSRLVVSPAGRSASRCCCEASQIGRTSCFLVPRVRPWLGRHVAEQRGCNGRGNSDMSNASHRSCSSQMVRSPVRPTFAITSGFCARKSQYLRRAHGGRGAKLPAPTFPQRSCLGAR